MNAPSLTLGALLYRSVAMTVENLVFMETDRLEEFDPVQVLASPRWFAVTAQDPLDLGISLVGASSLFTHFASQVFGATLEDLGPGADGDVGREMANMLAGRLLGTLMPADQVFALHLPTDGVGDPPCIHLPESSMVIVECTVDGQRLSVCAWGQDLWKRGAVLAAAGPAALGDGDGQGWGAVPAADPQTGRWPAGGTRTWS